MNSHPRKRTTAWLVLTFVLSWTIAFGFFAAGGRQHSAAWFLMAVVYMFVPSLATLVVEGLLRKGKVQSRLGISFRLNRWFLAGLLAPAGLAVLSTGLSLVQSGVAFTADPGSSNLFEFFGSGMPVDRVAELKRQLGTLPFHPFWLVLLGGTIAGLTINGAAGLGEELGWRGFLQSEWQALGFWRSSWLIGLVWGVWHAPFILHGYDYPGHPVAGVFTMTLWTILSAPLLGFVRLRSGSVFAAAITHGAINGTAIAPAIVLRGGDSLTVGVMGWPGLVVLAILNAAIYWFITRKKQRRGTTQLPGSSDSDAGAIQAFQ